MEFQLRRKRIVYLALPVAVRRSGGACPLAGRKLAEPAPINYSASIAAGPRCLILTELLKMYERACERSTFRSGVLCCHEGPCSYAIALDIVGQLMLCAGSLPASRAFHTYQRQANLWGIASQPSSWPLPDSRHQRRKSVSVPNIKSASSSILPSRPRTSCSQYALLMVLYCERCETVSS